MGRKKAPDHIRKISESLKGNTNSKGKPKWNKGMTGFPARSEETKKKISLANTGKVRTLEAREKIRKARTGSKSSVETRLKQSESTRGSKGNAWKGGVTEKNRSARNGLEFKLWREAVFKRDGWKCKKCKKPGGYLHPHHIFNFSTFINLRFAIDNGITMCKDCHMEFHRIFGKKNNTKDQLDDFLQR